MNTVPVNHSNATPDALDIRLLSYLRADTRAHLARMAITSLHQIAQMTPDDLRKIKGIKTQAEAIHCHACAFVENRPIWFGNLHDACHQPGFMFDIETHPTSGEVWSIGWQQHDHNVEIAIVAPHLPRQRFAMTADTTVILVHDSDSAWVAFMDSVGGDMLESPILHWTNFDSGIMQKTAPHNVTQALVWRMHDLHSSLNRAVKFPVRGSSLKTIAAYLGFGWAGTAAWYEAYAQYLHWLRDGEMSALKLACLYQRDDVLAMDVVVRWLRAFVPE